MELRQPDPPLTDGRARLRLWTVDDAATLVTAWADPDIQVGTAVPERRDLVAAHRWIDGQADRMAAGVAIDMVIVDERDQSPVGEVGLAPIDWPGRRAAIGYWTAASRRGEGWAQRAVRLLVDWALVDLPIDTVVAQTRVGADATAAVLRATGFELVARRDTEEIWTSIR